MGIFWWTASDKQVVADIFAECRCINPNIITQEKTVTPLKQIHLRWKTQCYRYPRERLTDWRNHSKQLNQSFNQQLLNNVSKKSIFQWAVKNRDLVRNTHQRGLRISRLEENEGQNQAKQWSLLLNREREKRTLPWSQSNRNNLLYSERKENCRKLIGKIKKLVFTEQCIIWVWKTGK